MKPNFALNLSHDGISLLHRNDGSKAGWSLVGEVALDDPEMTAKLDMLRKTAAGLDQSGVATKLVIPASQILFTEVNAPANDDITREVQIRAALEGLTPYEVGELVFDWRRAKGKAVKVAVVARETLQEAETFAKEHKFNPVSFVARGQNGFKGEVFFGMAPSASALLGAGEKVEPDTKPVPRIASLRAKAPGDSEKTEAEPDAKPDTTPDRKADTTLDRGAETGADTTSDAKAAPADEKSAPPAPGDQAAKGTPAPASGDADTQKEDALDEDARIAALLAEVPEPEPSSRAASTDLAGKKDGEKDGADKASAKSPAAARAGMSKVPPAPVLAPFPPSLDREDAARQAQKPAAKAVKKVTKSAAKPAAKTTGKAENPEKSAKTGKTGSRNIPPPPSRREIPPLAKSAIDGARQDEAGEGAKAPAAARSGNAADAKAEPAPSFASRRHISASGEVQKADLDAPGAVTPQPQAQEQTKKQTQKQARLRAMEMALAKAPAKANGAALSAQDSGKRRANGTIPPLPPRATIPAAAPSSASTAAQAGPALASDRAEGLAGGMAQGQASKTGQLQARLQRGASSAARLTRTATQAAAKAAQGLIKRRQPAPDSPAEPKAASPKLGNSIPTEAAGLRAGKTNGAGGTGTLSPAIANDIASPAIDTGIDTAIAPAPTSAGAGAASAPSEAERLTLFGARRAQQENIGGKPKFLGLILTLVLLLVMAIIALGSVFLLGNDTTGSTSQPASSDFAAASVPEALLPSPADGTSAALAPLPDAAPPSDPRSAPPSDPGSDAGATFAALPGAAQSPSAPEIATDPIAPLPAQDSQAVEPAPPPAAPRSPDVLSQEAAQTRYAATGIWEKAPLDPPEPRGSRIDDLYIASIDPKITGNDAVSLPPVAATAPESRPATPLPPAPPGTTFALSDEGLVTPSPEGTLSPEGILVFSGKPEVVAPPRPGIARPEILPDDALRAFRPKPRPTGLIEESQRANNGGNTLLELASLRPNARPRALAEQAIARARADEAAVDAAVAEVIAQGDIVNATEQAVAASPQPDHRPGNFATIVASARARADTSDGSTVVAASAAPTITPAIPTRANVATHATITNAIRLHDINLIGIYGSSSSRRALVRLKNGRYVKVSVGERLNGGKVVSITEKRLIYTKNGRNYTLELIALG